MKPGSVARNVQGQLDVAHFLSIARRRWPIPNNTLMSLLPFDHNRWILRIVTETAEKVVARAAPEWTVMVHSHLPPSMSRG